MQKVFELSQSVLVDKPSLENMQRSTSIATNMFYTTNMYNNNNNNGNQDEGNQRSTSNCSRSTTALAAASTTSISSTITAATEYCDNRDAESFCSGIALHPMAKSQNIAIDGIKTTKTVKSISMSTFETKRIEKTLSTLVSEEQKEERMQEISNELHEMISTAEHDVRGDGEKSITTTTTTTKIISETAEVCSDKAETTTTTNNEEKQTEISAIDDDNDDNTNTQKEAAAVKNITTKLNGNENENDNVNETSKPLVCTTSSNVDISSCDVDANQTSKPTTPTTATWNSSIGGTGFPSHKPIKVQSEKDCQVPYNIINNYFSVGVVCIKKNTLCILNSFQLNSNAILRIQI